MISARARSCLRFLAIAPVLFVGASASAQIGDEDLAIVESLRNSITAHGSNELRSFRSMGMGEAFVGGGSGVGAVYANPAGILSAALYEGSAGYQRAFGPSTNAVGASLVDAKTNPSVAAGFTYSLGFGRDEALQEAFDANEGAVSNTNNRILDHDIRGVLAFPIVPQRVSLGVGARYLHHTRGTWTQRVTQSVQVTEPGDGGGTSTTVEVSDQDYAIRFKGVTLDAGIMALASENISLGFAAQNLIKVDGLSPGRRLRAGAAVFVDALHIEAEWFATQHPDTGVFEHGAAIGLEYRIVTTPIRAGFRYESSEAMYLGLGIGARGQRVGGDLGFEQNTQNSQDRILGGSVSVYF